MGSTAEKLMNDSLLMLGETQLEENQDFNDLADNQLIIYRHLLKAHSKIFKSIKLPTLRNEQVITLVSGLNEYNLPSDIYLRRVEYLYGLDVNNKNVGYIEIVDYNDWRKRYLRVGGDLIIKAYIDSSGKLAFTKTPTDNNTTLKATDPDVLYLVYYKEPTALTQYNIESDVPSEFDTLYEFGTKYYYYLETKQLQDAQFWLREFNQEIISLKKLMQEQFKIKLYHESENFNWIGGW